MAKGRISGGSEDFGASGLPKKLSPFGSSPAESANIGGSQKNNRIFKKRRIYQLGTSVPTVETIEDARADKPEDT
jgi:hypothetical protein